MGECEAGMDIVRAEIHENGLVLKRLTRGYPHGCMDGRILKTDNPDQPGYDSY